MATGAPGVQVGVLWRDPVEGLSQIGRRWDEAHLDWAATGALGAAKLAPLQTQVAGQPCRCKGRGRGLALEVLFESDPHNLRAGGVRDGHVLLEAGVQGVR